MYNKKITLLILTACTALVFIQSGCNAEHKQQNPSKKHTSCFNVRDFGATGNGKILDTDAIQRAIDTCSKSGTGKVIVPAGKYLVGCIELKSNVNLHLEPAAVLLGSTNIKDYTVKTPAFESRTNNLYVNRSIIYAEKADNISLTGSGIINGQGRARSFSQTRPQSNRPYIARFIECRNVIMRDISMLESANWTCHILGCSGVLVDGIKIKNSVRANRDGLDIDSSNQVSVYNCRIFSQDDAIVLKSTAPVLLLSLTVYLPNKKV